jgi:hypothetical protein
MQRPRAEGLTPSDDFSTLVRHAHFWVRQALGETRAEVLGFPETAPANSGLIAVRLPGVPRGEWTVSESVLARVDTGRVVQVFRTAAATGFGEPPAGLFQT